ncbi:MAG TPA: hypothetical protein VK504_33445 [Vicinamibacterales bacterium]|nr:hypothetical protein [Vicinamibacterales bacterium]
MASRRQQIVEVFRTRLQAIRLISGFETDAGALVLLGETPELGTDDPDQVIAIVVDDELPSHQGENVASMLPIVIAALAKADLDEPWLAVEAVLGDIKKAVELEDRTLGGLVPARIQRGPTRTMTREAGSVTVGVAIEYRAPLVERWGNP